MMFILIGIMFAMMIVVSVMFISYLFEIHVLSLQKGFHVHKWRNIYALKKSAFNGKITFKYTRHYRICSVCDEIQIQEMDCVMTWWSTVDAKTYEMVKKTMYEKYGELLLKEEVV